MPKIIFKVKSNYLVSELLNYVENYNQIKIFKWKKQYRCTVKPSVQLAI